MDNGVVSEQDEGVVGEFGSRKVRNIGGVGDRGGEGRGEEEMEIGVEEQALKLIL